jgi:hypothetical protein
MPNAHPYGVQGMLMRSDNRKNKNSNNQIMCLFLALIMCFPTASAALTEWTGPSAIPSSGTPVVTNGFIVPGNATILDGWVNVGVDGMMDAGQGMYLNSYGTDFTNGTLDGTSLDHFGDILSLAPDQFVNQMTDFESGLNYLFPNSVSQSGLHNELWAVSDVTIRGMVPSNGAYNMPYGDIPATTTDGGFLLGTNPTSSVSGDVYQSLELPSFLTPHPNNDFVFSFDHWYHVDTSADSLGDGDGVWLEYRVNVGEWTYIAPEGGYPNTINPDLTTLNFTLDGDYDGENSTLNVYETLPSNIPWSGTIISQDGSIANYTGFVGSKFNNIDQGNETPFNSSALNNSIVTIGISPTDAPTGGQHGFPVWASINASGWVTSEFNLSNVSEVSNSNSIQFRFNYRSSNNSEVRPGWYIDNIGLSNPGLLAYDAWLYGCSPDDGCTTPNANYANLGGGALVFPVDLSSATVDPTINLEAFWALEGGSTGDNMFVEVSKDNTTWEDVIAVGSTPANPIPSSGTVGDSQGYESLEYTYPAGYVGDSTTWFRVRVATDSSLGCAYPHYSEHCGVFVDNLSISDSNTGSIMFSDNFHTTANGWHEAAPHAGFNPNNVLGVDDWKHVSNNQGAFSFSESFENPMPFSAEGFVAENLYSASEWQFGEIPSPYVYYGPTSFASGDYGFGVNLDGEYVWSAPQLHTRLTTPVYTLLDNATSYLSFNHWICAEPDYDGGTVFISVNGSEFTHFQPYVAGGYNNTWYDDTISLGGLANNPLYGYDVFIGQGYGQPSGGGSCSQTVPSTHPGWEKMRGSLDNYNGSTVQFRFEFAADRYWNYDGWYLDDLGIEVDYFQMDGKWKSELFAIDELGAGFVDATMEVPNGTWVTGSILNAGGQVVPGFENLTIPFSLAGLDLELYPNVRIQLNFGTDDPHFSPKLTELFFGGMRSFESAYAENNGWDVPDTGIVISDAGNMSVSDGQAHTISSEFIYSSRPMKTFDFIGYAANTTAYLKDISGNVLGNISVGQQIVFDKPQPGYAVDIVLEPGGYINWVLVVGTYTNPALNPQIDILNDGVIDWEFPADPYYGHFGWQNRYYGVTEDGTFTQVNIEDRGLELEFSDNEIITIHTLIPDNASVESALLPFVVTDSSVTNFAATYQGQTNTLTGVIDSQGVINLPLNGQVGAPAELIADGARTFWNVGIELTTNTAATISVGPMAIGYDVVENISGLEPLFESYHQSNNDNGTANDVRYNLSFVADRGGVSVDGAIYHELLITNEPFTPPTTFYPDGTIQTVTTSHYHLEDNNLIETVRLRATGSSGAFIEVNVQDLDGTPIFTQVLGSQYLTLIPAESSVVFVDDHWVIDWSFNVQWDWDDEATLTWKSLAMDADGYGISPYTATSGGAGYNAVENDLVVTDFEIYDKFDRLVVEDSWVDDNSTLTLYGNVTFEDAMDRIPETNAFNVVANLSGMLVNMTSSESGSWSGTVTTPVRGDEGAGTIIRYPLSAQISRVGPGDGAVGGMDETRERPTVEFRIDDESPKAERLQIYTSGQYIDADGYTWDPAKEISLLFTLSDNQSLGSEVTMHYWIQDMHDLYDPEVNGKNGQPDVQEYATMTMMIFNSGIAGEETVSFLPINLEVNAENHRVSIYFTGIDFAGNELSNGGSPGYETDYATVYTAINEPTEILQNFVYINTESEYLMVGQNHTMSMRIDEPNGIGTVDYITVYLLGETEETLGVMTYYPVSEEYSTPEGSHLVIHDVDVTPFQGSQYNLNFHFSLDWDFPEIAKGGWNLPSIVLEDTDPVTNPGTYDLVLTNIGTNRWSLDNELMVKIVNMSDLTPPMTDGSAELLYVAEGDDISITGVVEFANARTPIKTIPSELLVNLDFYYGTEEVHGDSIVTDEEGTFEIVVTLPTRSLSNPILPLEMSISGIPELGIDVTDINSMIVVDSDQPTVSFGANTFKDLTSDELSAVLITIIINDQGGIADGPLALHWAYTDGFGGPEIIGSRDSATVQQTSGGSSGSTSWTYQEAIDMSPNEGVRLNIGDGLKVWVITQDLAGNMPLGTGTESQPRFVEIDVQSFRLEISEINVIPADPYVGETITISYLAKNIGNKEGEGNVSLQLKNDFGNWTTISSTMVSLTDGQSFQPDPFIYEIGSEGILELRIIIDGFEGESFPVLGSDGAAINVESGERDDGGVPLLFIGIGVFLVVGVIGSIAFVLLRNQDEEDYLDDAEEMVEKEAPEVPTSHGRQESDEPVDTSAHPDLAEAMEAFPSWGEDVLLQYLEAGWSVQQMKDEFYE